MAAYALDIDNTRVQSAMEELGVSQEELISKNFEDFADPHISPEIQLLRFEHYSKLLKSTVHEIKEKIKNKNLDCSPSEHRNFNHLLPHSSQSSKSVLQLSKYPFKQMALLESTLSTFGLSQLPKHKRLQSNKSDQDHSSETPNPKNIREKIEQLKKLQVENLKKLKNDQVKSQQLLFQKNEKMMENHLKREKSLEEINKMKARAKEENFQRKLEEIQMRKTIYEASLEDDITEKLKFYENKVRKSEEIYHGALKEKVEKAAKFKERAEIVQRNLEVMKKSNEVEVFRRLVDKHEIVKNHRDRIDERIQQLAQTKREKFDKHRIEALEKIKKAEQDFIKKSKSTEKNFITAQKNVSERKLKIQHEMLLRKELKRLKDLECLIKIKRAKKRFDAKNSRSLQKTLEKYQKIDEFKQEREKMIANSRDSAIKAMIEKEKFLEAVAIICKSPRSKTSKEKLKALNLKSKESSVSELKDN